MDAPARIAMALVYPKPGARPLVRPHVDALALSMKAIGLQTPITVRTSQQYASRGKIDAYEIVAGHHRYEAAISLGWKEVDAFITDALEEDAELWEIDENFARAELTDAQRADHHARRETILVKKKMVLPSSGKAGRPAGNLDKLSKYASQASESLGVDERTIRRDLRRGKTIDPDILSVVAGTDLDKGVVLDELASTPREAQPAKLVEIRERRAISPAPEALNDVEATEKQLTRLMAAWNAAGAEARTKFLERVDVPVMDRRLA